MALIPTNAAQVQQFAGALYGLAVGTQTMAHVMSDIEGSSLDVVLNHYYAMSFGSQTTASVGSQMVANLGLSGDAATAGAAYVSAHLSSAAESERGDKKHPEHVFKHDCRSGFRRLCACMERYGRSSGRLQWWIKCLTLLPFWPWRDATIDRWTRYVDGYIWR